MTVKDKFVATGFAACIVAVFALETVLILIFMFGTPGARQTENILLSKPALVVHLLVIIGTICLLYGRFVEPYRIEVKTIPIRTAKLARACFRLVHISDLHCDTKPRNEKKLVALINAMEPDIIVFTGDTLSIDTASALPLFKDTMKNLRADLGKFAVRGNVDLWHLPKLDLFGATGFEVLDADTVRLEKNGETLLFSGLSCEHPWAFRDLLKDVPENLFSIFLYHYADLVDDLEDLNVDLYLCGHTHGGQVALPIYGALITLSELGKKYESGMFAVSDTILYVNRGIGLEGGFAPKVRFLARPEITVFDIGPKNSRDD